MKWSDGLDHSGSGYTSEEVGEGTSAEDLWQRVLTDLFSTGALDVAMWERTADALAEAASLIEPDLKDRWDTARKAPEWKALRGDIPLGLNGVCLMLKAFEIENLCKGALLKSLPEDQRKRILAGSLPNPLKTHDLPRLCRDAGVTLDQDEEDQLVRLTRSIWLGRYPVPTRSLNVDYPESARRQKMNGNQVIDADFEVTARIVAKLRANLARP